MQNVGPVRRLARPVTIVMAPVVDERPAAEREAPGWRLAHYQSHDREFGEPVTSLVTRQMIGVLRDIGSEVRLARTHTEMERLDALRLAVRVRHFQVVESLSLVSAIPHPIIHLMTTDTLAVHIAIDVELVRNRDGLVVFAEPLELDDQTPMPTGVFNTARIGRGAGYPLRLLRHRLDGLLARMADEVAARLSGAEGQGPRLTRAPTQMADPDARHD